MIEINERLPVSTTTLSVAYMSNRTFFKRYAAIYGLSGTIGSTPETKLLSGLYSVQAWKVRKADALQNSVEYLYRVSL